VTEPCPFCLITHGLAPAEIVQQWDDAIAIVPLNPVTPGHLLVIPRQHVPDALTVPEVAALTMQRAAELATGSCNLITSVGAEATQTVRHLHLHIVPRRAGDGLALPWMCKEPSDVG
jgi:histidine triad (HIT) family protein